jgi:hypothetical protein
MLTITLNFLSTDESHELTVPSDLSIESLYGLLPDFTDAPPDTLRLIYGGRALRSDETLESIGIQEGHVISVAGKPLSRTDTTPVEIPELRRRLCQLQLSVTTAADASSAAGLALFEREYLQAMDQLLEATQGLETELENWCGSSYDTMTVVDGRLVVPNAGPAITEEDRAELERIKEVIAGYANENRVADVYNASDLYRTLSKS